MNIGKYGCAYCGSERRGNALIRTADFAGAIFACGECKAKHKKKLITKPGWIYMIGYDEWWKIGLTTKSPELRVNELQNGNPNVLRLAASKLVNDCLVSEVFIHRRLSGFHHRGEWFHGPEDKIKELAGFD